MNLERSNLANRYGVKQINSLIQLSSKSMQFNSNRSASTSPRALNSDLSGKPGCHQDRSAARFDATAAFENAKSRLNRSPFPITEPNIQEKLRRLESALG